MPPPEGEGIPCVRKNMGSLEAGLKTLMHYIVLGTTRCQVGCKETGARLLILFLPLTGVIGSNLLSGRLVQPQHHNRQ